MKNKPVVFEQLGEQHFCVYTDVPMRIEVSLVEGNKIVMFGYRGTDIDMEQEPIVHFDGIIDGGAVLDDEEG